MIVVLYSIGIIIVQCHDVVSLRSRRDVDGDSSSTIQAIPTNITKWESERDLTLFGSRNCPPSGFDAKQDFNIDLYFGRWYAQKQIPVAYQTMDEFYCVTADYTKDTNFCIFCNYAARIDILNQARKGSVNGDKLGGANRFFRGIIRRPRTDPAKITVGFWLHS